MISPFKRQVRAWLAPFMADRRGGVAIFFAIAAFGLALATALAVDASRSLSSSQKLQTATDAAVLGLARLSSPPADPTAAARGAVSSNLSGLSATLTSVAAAQNADGSYTVTASASLPTTMSVAGLRTMNVSKSSTAVASTSPGKASFAIGTTLASLNGGIFNAVLGGLLGANVSLSVMDYNALASVNIDLFQLSNALATNLNMQAVTYDQLVAGSFSVGDIMNAAIATPNMTSGSKTALSSIASAMQGSTKRVMLGNLVDFGPYGSLKVGVQPIGVSLNALDLVNVVAQIANGAHQIEVGVNAGIPGLANVTLALTVGERPVHSSMVTVGAAGASVHTAQTRLLLRADVGVPGFATMSLPIYIELAAGTAMLSSVQCQSGPTTANVTLGVTPSLVDAWIGDVGLNQMTDFTRSPSPPPAKLLSVNILGLTTSVSARAHANIGNVSATPVSFSYADIQAATKKTTNTKNFIASLLSSLIGDTRLTATALGVSVSIPTALTSAIATALSNALSPLDQVISGVLQVAGIGLGQATTWVTGVQCGSNFQARLVK